MGREVERGWLGGAALRGDSEERPVGGKGASHTHSWVRMTARTQVAV